MRDESMVESLLSHPNRLVIATLVLLSALAWLQLFNSGEAAVLGTHHVHSVHSLAYLDASGLRNLGVLILMWLLMAVAMMLPTAAPAILSFADIAFAGRDSHWPPGRVAAFVGGYLCTWSGFGVLAATIQSGFATLAQRFPVLDGHRPLLGGAVLVGVGLYQFSSLKEVCLTQCRSPLGFFLAHWRDGARGAMYLGLRHGIHCVGCCWALMSLMLLAGGMSIVWTVVLTAVMLIEKIVPAGRTVVRAIGIVLIVVGGVVMASDILRSVVI